MNSGFAEAAGRASSNFNLALKNRGSFWNLAPKVKSRGYSPRHILEGNMSRRWMFVWLFLAVGSAASQWNRIFTQGAPDHSQSESAVEGFAKQPPQEEVLVRAPPKAKPPATGRRIATGASEDCDSGHWVNSVIDDGAIVTLEDESVWQIDSLDRIDTALWLPTTDIIACSDKLINTEDSEKAGARRLR